MTQSAENPYRLLPSVEEVLSLSAVEALAQRVRRELLTGFVQEALAGWRTAIGAGELDAEGVRERLERGDLARSVEARVRREEGSGLRWAVNATGVVLHTGLGRAPLHPRVAEAMARAARGYCVLEVDRFSGRRNRRDERLGVLLTRLTGAEAAIAVNNNAAAVLLTLSTFAARRSTVVSRGELVEIGGSFRMPDVMERANTTLVEVGTTNRTRAADYRAALERPGTDVGLLLKVHTSNFRQVGFTAEVEPEELARLGAEHGVTTGFDLGSGWIGAEASPLAALEHEPRIDHAVQSGVDVVTFSGDKLLGGPQAGLLVGKHEAIERLRANPMYRALRLDKVALAGLEATLELHLAGRAAGLPARALMHAPPAAMRAEAQAIAAALEEAGFGVRVEEGASQPGSGSAPGSEIPTWVVRVAPGAPGAPGARGVTEAPDAERMAAFLRANDPPVFARIQADELVLDPRTLLEGERDVLVTAFVALARGLERGVSEATGPSGESAV